MSSLEGRHHLSVRISCDWHRASKYGVAGHCELQWETAAGRYTDPSFASQAFYKIQSLQKGAQDSGKTCIPGLPLSCNGLASASPNQSMNGMMNVQAVSTGAGPGLFKKLGRVLREKAAGDLERVFKGTSKTREKLGVSYLMACPFTTAMTCASCSPHSAGLLCQCITNIYTFPVMLRH